MSIAADIQSLSPSAIIELFVVDTSSAGGPVTYLHAGTNKLTQPLVWQGVTYAPLPIEAEGFDIATQGTLPRPKIRVANTGGLFSYEVMIYDDLVGCKVIRKRTMMKYLDAVNFPDGVNPTADPNQYFSDEIWYVERKLSENRYIIEWELASPFDLIGVLLPRRQVIQGSCPWRYRGPECGYSGSSYFDINDSPTTAAKDVCAKRLASCNKRFPSGNVPFGGFPGVVKY